MAQQTSAFLSPTHRRLLRVARIASAFAWLALGYQVVLTLAGVIADLYTGRLLVDTAARLLGLASSVAGHLLSGIVSWLLLRGVALGLSMLVETDCNYRAQPQGQHHE